MNSLHLLCFRIFIIATDFRILEITQLQSIRNIRLTSCNINFHINKMYSSYNLQWFSYIFHIRAQELFPKNYSVTFCYKNSQFVTSFTKNINIQLLTYFFNKREQLLKLLFLFVIELSFPNT